MTLDTILHSAGNKGNPAEPDSPDGRAQAAVPVIDVLLADGHQQQFGFGENQLQSGGTKGHLQVYKLDFIRYIKLDFWVSACDQRLSGDGPDRVLWVFFMV